MKSLKSSAFSILGVAAIFCAAFMMGDNAAEAACDTSVKSTTQHQTADKQDSVYSTPKAKPARHTVNTVHAPALRNCIVRHLDSDYRATVRICG